MANNNRAAKEAVGDEKPAEENTAAEEVPVPTLAEDIAELEKLNLMRALTLQLQGGRHPQDTTDALLRRRMNLDPTEFQGPYVIRLICTILMIFVCCSIWWFIFWLMASALNLTYFIKLLSTGLSTLIAAMAGAAIFHPSSLLNEKKLKKAIEEHLHQMRKDLESETVQHQEATTKSKVEAPLADNDMPGEPPTADAPFKEPTPKSPVNNDESAQQSPADEVASDQPKEDEAPPNKPPAESINEQETTNTNNN